MGIHVDCLTFRENKDFDNDVIRKIKKQIIVGKEDSGIFKYIGIKSEGKQKMKLR